MFLRRVRVWSISSAWITFLGVAAEISISTIYATMLVGSHLSMPLTRNFKETIQARVKRDAAFRKDLLRESVESFVLGDIETGKAVLRDYINATIGFAELAEVTHHSAKSLMRMLSPSGNPQARNLFEIVEYLQRKERVRFKVVASIRRCLAQARKGAGRPADEVFDEPGARRHG